MLIISFIYIKFQNALEGTAFNNLNKLKFRLVRRLFFFYTFLFNRTKETVSFVFVLADHSRRRSSRLYEGPDQPVPRLRTFARRTSGAPGELYLASS